MSQGQLPAPEAGRLSVGWRYFVAAILVTGVVARLVAAANSFWLDEIMSYVMIRQNVSLPWEILTRFHSDNNHPLNSLWLYVVGEQPHWYFYRLPSLLAGVGTIAIGARLLGRRSKMHGAIAVLVLAISYPLIVYASEARGYGPMVFFTMWAIAIADRRFGWTTRHLNASSHVPPRQAASGYDSWLFSIAVILGFLAHPTFIHAYGALVAWTVYCAEEQNETIKDVFLELLRWHLAPAIFLLFYYNAFLRNLHISGADPASLIDVLVATCSLALGGPERGALAQLALVVWVAALVKGLQHVYQRDFGAFLFFLSAIVIMPALMIVVQPFVGNGLTRYFPRYFLVSHTAFLLLAVYWLGDVYRDEASKRAVCVAAIMLFCLGNLNHTMNFLRFGRGHYREALHYMAELTPGPSIRVCSNHDFRATMLLKFYQRYLPLDQELIYVTGDDRASADWCILSAATPLRVVPKVVTAQDTRFALKRFFPSYGLSGSDWWIYGRVAPEEDQPPSKSDDEPADNPEPVTGDE